MCLQKKKEPKLVRPSETGVEYDLVLEHETIGHIAGNLIQEETQNKLSYLSLQWFNVDKKYRQKGYGRKLMQAVVNDLQAYNEKHSDNPIAYIRVYPSPDDVSLNEIYQIYEHLGLHFVCDNPNRNQYREEMRLDLV